MRGVFLAVLFLLASTAASSAATSDELQRFIGNWSCVLTSGGSTYLSTSTNAMWGAWVKEEIHFPAQMGQPASVGTAYLGYDPSTHKWIYSEIDSVGEYFTNQSASPRLSDSKWKSVFPAGNVSAISMVSHSRYTVDGRYSESGKTSTFQQICTRK